MAPILNHCPIVGGDLCNFGAGARRKNPGFSSSLESRLRLAWQVKARIRVSHAHAKRGKRRTPAVSRHENTCSSCQRRTLLKIGAGLCGISTNVDAWARASQAMTKGESVRPVPLGLSLLALQNSVPQSWVQDFQGLVGRSNKVRLKTEKDLDKIFELLSLGKAETKDLVTIGDAWLARAIQGEYLVPLEDAKQYRWFSNLPIRFRKLVTRNEDGMPAEDGLVWAVPYRWGCTAVAYREEKQKKIGFKEIEDWGDLLQPSLKKRIAFLDSPQEFVGVVLKTFGLRYNSKLSEIRSKGISEMMLIERAGELKNQILTFSNREHVRALAAEDAWVTVGSSSDLLPLAGTIPSVKIIVPRSGTALWCDLFVATSDSKEQSASTALGTSPLVNAWFDFVLSPSRSHGRGLQTGVSPLELPDAEKVSCNDVNVHLDGKGRFLPNRCLLESSEFLLPLDKERKDLFRRILS